MHIPLTLLIRFPSVTCLRRASLLNTPATFMLKTGGGSAVACLPRTCFHRRLSSAFLLRGKDWDGSFQPADEEEGSTPKLVSKGILSKIPQRLRFLERDNRKKMPILSKTFRKIANLNLIECSSYSQYLLISHILKIIPFPTDFFPPPSPWHLQLLIGGGQRTSPLRLRSYSKFSV